MFFYTPISAEELDEDELHCAKCCRVVNEGCLDGDSDFYCETCIEALIVELEADAEVFAQENCRITTAIPEYDPACEHRCTPEEYLEGYRESYTENSHRCHCRHNCTNYDDLIRNLDRHTVKGQVYYSVIRDRIEELLDDADVGGGGDD